MNSLRQATSTHSHMRGRQPGTRPVSYSEAEATLRAARSAAIWANWSRAVWRSSTIRRRRPLGRGSLRSCRGSRNVATGYQVMKRYAAIIERVRGSNYCAWVPDPPGRVSTRDTLGGGPAQHTQSSRISPRTECARTGYRFRSRVRRGRGIRGLHRRRT